MESLGDILKRLTQKSTSEGTASTSEQSTLEPEREEERCLICGGIGWVRKNVPVNHPDFGKHFPCRCQEKGTQGEHYARLHQYSNLGALARFNFDNLNPSGTAKDKETQGLFQKAYQAALAFAENPRGWMVLSGPSGCGKTHLAAAVANYRVSRNRLALFVSVPDLLDHLRSAFSPSAEVSFDEMFEQVRNSPFLVLDDLGAQSGTPWAMEKLFQILNHRYNLSLPTIMTLAVPLDHLEERWKTRLTDSGISQVYQLQEWTSIKSSRINLGSPEPKLLEHMTFESFHTRGNDADPAGRASLEAAFKASKEFAREPKGWLVLAGTHGCGKTHLAIAIYNTRLKSGSPPFYAFVPDLLDHLRSTFNPQSQVTYDQLFEQVKRASLLILDGLGLERSSPWADEKLNQIIVYRHSAELPTVITTTRLLEELQESISSRLKDIHLVALHPISAPDYRDSSRSPGVGKTSRGAR